MQPENGMQFGCRSFFEFSTEAFFVSGGVFVTAQDYHCIGRQCFYRIKRYIALKTVFQTVAYRIK